MPKHNYSQYSSKKNNDSKAEREANLENKPAPVKMVVEPVETAAVAKVEPVETAAVAKVEPVETAAVAKVEPVETAAVAKVEPVEVKTTPAIVKGVVTKCARLNVRAYPSVEADVVCVLDVMSEVEVNADKSTYDWVCVCTATGIEGYCMKQFVETSL